MSAATITSSRRLLVVAGVVLATLGAGVPSARAGVDVVDRSFGDGGTLVLDLPGVDHPAAMVRTTTGNLAVSITAEGRLWLVLVSADGRLLPSFAGDGIRELRLAARADVVGLASTRDGGVLVAAWLWDGTATPLGDSRFAIAKVLADGRLDTSYGTDGVATTGVGELAPLDIGVHQFAATHDGGAVVVGTTGAATYYGAAGVPALLRFAPDGGRDETFGVDGIAPMLTDAAYPVFAGLAIAPDGGILVAENNYTAGPFRSEALVRRFTTRGAPDAAFGTAGVALLPIPGDWKSVDELAVDARGRVVALGGTHAGLTGVVTSRLGVRSPITPEDGFSPLVVRLEPSGRPDDTYGEGGVAVFNTDGKGTRLSWPGDLALTDDVAHLTAYEERSAELRTHLVRLTATGGIDRTYGGARPVRLPMQNTSDVAALAGRVVVAGERSWHAGGTVLAAYAP